MMTKVVALQSISFHYISWRFLTPNKDLGVQA